MSLLKLITDAEARFRQGEARIEFNERNEVMPFPAPGVTAGPMAARPTTPNTWPRPVESFEKRLAASPDLGNPLLLARLRAMPLDQFACEGQPLEIRVKWLPDHLWFVPYERDAVSLVTDGVGRGRIWTAKELLDLLAIPGLTDDQLLTIATAKALFGGILASVRERSDPASPDPESVGASLWPDLLPGLGPRHVASFEPCANCEAWSWARYGDAVLCLRCARQRETRRDDTHDPH